MNELYENARNRLFELLEGSFIGRKKYEILPADVLVVRFRGKNSLIHAAFDAEAGIIVSTRGALRGGGKAEARVEALADQLNRERDDEGHFTVINGRVYFGHRVGFEEFLTRGLECLYYGEKQLDAHEHAFLVAVFGG